MKRSVLYSFFKGTPPVRSWYSENPNFCTSRFVFLFLSFFSPWFSRLVFFLDFEYVFHLMTAHALEVARPVPLLVYASALPLDALSAPPHCRPFPGIV